MSRSGNKGNIVTFLKLPFKCSNPEYSKKFSEMYLLPIRRDIDTFSERNALSWDGGKVSRLNSSLLPLTTTHYFHYLQVKQFIQQEGKITGIKSIIRCKQDYIFKDFMNEVRNMREDAKTEFEKDFYKLIMNSIYGKTIMNEENFCESKFITDPKKI